VGLLARAAVVAGAALAGAALVACYEPRLRDCTLSCSAASDCAGDHACNGGWCVAPGASCDGSDGGGSVTADARAIDAPRMVELRIEVRGRGRVESDRSGVGCGPDDDCRFDLPAGTDVVLTPIDGEGQFREWRNACENQGATCTLTLGTDTHARADFDSSDDD
jgi:hypothetical protein